MPFKLNLNQFNHFSVISEGIRIKCMLFLYTFLMFVYMSNVCINFPCLFTFPMFVYISRPSSDPTFPTFLFWLAIAISKCHEFGAQYDLILSNVHSKSNWCSSQ